MAAPKFAGPLSFFGTLLTLIGLIFTYIQVVKARNASTAAKIAAKEMRIHYDNASANFAEALIPALRNSINDDKFELAEWQFSQVRRIIFSHIATDLQDESLKRSFRVISKNIQIGSSKNGNVNKSRAYAAIDGLTEHIALINRRQLEQKGAGSL